MLNVYIHYKIFVPAILRCTSLHHLGLQQNAAQTMQTLSHAPGMAIHTLPFILPLHVSRRLTGHKHE